MRVLYCHGFASSPASAKIVALRPYLEPRGIELVTPDLNVPSFLNLDWQAMVRRSIEEGEETRPVAVVGSSLGALVAMETVRLLAPVPLVLIAPALGIAERWRTELPDGDPIVVWNHALGADAPIHRLFFEQMAALHVDDEPPSVRTTVIMGRRDETVPFDLVAETWERWRAKGLAAGSKFIEIAEGDHGLTAHVALIAGEIEKAVCS
jgi:pimeloyl-ACP methyl ester carboxylesterase